ncbi:hypothetical protein ACWDZX_34890, partial [Streptomyces collinus]
CPDFWRDLTRTNPAHQPDLAGSLSNVGIRLSVQDPHFTRNIALYTAELADDLAREGRPDEAAQAALRVLGLLDQVQSSRIQTMLAGTARVLLPHRRASGVSEFLDRHASLPRTGRA